MGREGPCWHCGITHTPLWRNGPLEKPVLCNACGSRYRLKGTLEDYTPKHAQIVEGEAVVPTRRTRKRNSSSADATLTSSHDHKGKKPTSGSSSLKKKNQERGAILEKIWKSGIPSRKRSSVSYRKLTATKRFLMELSYVLKNGVEDSAILSKEHEEEDHVLINNANNLMISPNEIGIGCILLKENTNIISSSTEKSSDNKHTPILEYPNGSRELNDPQTRPPPPTLTL